ncbi:hypothetical protein A1O3_00670 [Capronia epimyces CBS 606.96]|uniref:Zn(2)-C6 fungal-type domain-containing protein n=1 Tax=Capronia epimyces CBS 606.96 TaxID=1182542 RepID=W9YR21_9EURO|nr:uncharacterized protein A1O3_00670 [Capronia epimyces CBS 606.96]EXJ92120.1 hypothetical protein A1O3_00670 [Capronia epimyces CBS 606.96]
MSSRPPSTSTSPYNEALGFGSDHAQGPSRKKMRKGTRSCLECRRRKIKCTFEPGRPAICNECYARGSTCIDQEHGDVHAYSQVTTDLPSYSLRERVTQLEDLVKQVLNRLPEKPSNTSSNSNSDSTSASDADRSHVDAQAAEVLKSLKGSWRQANAGAEESLLLPVGLRDDAPVLTLFDNAVITRKESQAVVSRAQYNKTKTLLAALNKLLPPPQDLETILDSSHEWWAIWRTIFPEMTDSRCETIKESVSHSLRSEKPAELAKIMLCIALSIHQLPADFDWSQLSIKEEPAALMERYIATVDKLITSDDEIAATIDGIECMMLEAKYHINMGRPRRAWLLFHRAIAFAQLLGFHRLPSQVDKTSSDYRRSVVIWCHLIIGDRYLALLLGLPYSVADAFVTPHIPSAAGVSSPAEAIGGETYVAMMLPILTRINDRNQSVTPMGYSATLRLDQELEELYGTRDASWWSIDVIPGIPTEAHFERLQAQFLHHQARVLLHMPFMLRSSADKRYQYSHSAALEGAREMIRIYDALRTNKDVGPFICKLVDFQAFTAAMLLLLNLCGYAQQHRGNSGQPVDLEQDQADSQLIDQAVTLLKHAATEPGGVVAAQSAQALEMLARVRQGCDEADLKQCRSESVQVSIPYFGTISIGLGKNFVPIKPGTYVRGTAGASLTNTSNPAKCVSHMGLPTPPSISSGSTQQSPLSTTIDNPHSQASAPQAQRLPIYESTTYIAPGLEHAWPDSDDPFVTFDSFMAFPSGPSDGMTGTSGFAPQPTSQSPHGSATHDLNADAAARGLGHVPGQGYSFGSNPFGQVPVDLDQGWNWFGVDAPSS